MTTFAKFGNESNKLLTRILSPGIYLIDLRGLRILTVLIALRLNEPIKPRMLDRTTQKSKTFQASLK